MTGIVTQANIESEILRISGILEEQTGEFQDAIRSARHAEADYRLAFAKAFVRHRVTDKVAEKTAEHMALIDCEDLLYERKRTEGLERHLEEQLRSLRAQLDAVRTLAANVRAQT